jgi:hypothetical protein
MARNPCVDEVGGVDGQQWEDVVKTPVFQPVRSRIVSWDDVPPRIDKSAACQ